MLIIEKVVFSREEKSILNNINKEIDFLWESADGSQIVIDELRKIKEAITNLYEMELVE